MSSSTRSSGMRMQILLLVALLAIAGAIVAVLVVNSDDDSGPGTEVASSEPGPLDQLARRTDGDPLALGDVNAPVVMVEYSDYRCPFCGRFSRDTETVLIEQYVDAGLLRLEWRDFPNFGPESELAARAGRAAADQGLFWEFNAEVYEHAPENGHATLTADVLAGYAENVGVPDMDRFRADMASDKYDAAIAADAAEARSFGASGTPTFSVHGTPVVGAQPTEVFVTLIEQALGD